MNKWLTVLSALLAVQLVLAVVLHLDNDDAAAEQAQAKLLDFEVAQIDRLEIRSPEASLVLTQDGDQWRLPEHENAVVKPDQVDLLLDRLSLLKKGWPVAKTQSAARRFKVSEDDFKRQLVLYQGDQQIESLWVGDSSGLRQSHVRKPGEDAIYRVKFDVWQASTQHEDWLAPPPEAENTREDGEEASAESLDAGEKPGA